MEYDFELEKVVEIIKQKKAKKVVLQLPDGLKPKAKEIYDFIKEKTGCELMVYLGSCFGACDIPRVDCDLLVQFGHSEKINDFVKGKKIKDLK